MICFARDKEVMTREFIPAAGTIVLHVTPEAAMEGPSLTHKAAIAFVSA
jgi:hypothetical protein